MAAARRRHGPGTNLFSRRGPEGNPQYSPIPEDSVSGARLRFLLAAPSEGYLSVYLERIIINSLIRPFIPHQFDNEPP